MLRKNAIGFLRMPALLRSAQFEHTFLCTATGCEVLTARTGAPTTSMPPFDPKTWQR